MSLVECRTAEEVRALSLKVARRIASRWERPSSQFSSAPVPSVPGMEALVETVALSAGAQEHDLRAPLRLGWRDVVRRVASAHDLMFAHLLSRSRLASVSHPRQLCFWLCRELVTYRGKRVSLPQIGRWFGFDHTTVLHGIRATEQRMEADASYRARVMALKAELISSFA